MDTCVLVAGAAAFRSRYLPGINASADLLYKWIDEGGFEWLFSKDTLTEYKEVLNRRGVRPYVIGRIINLLHEEGIEVAPEDVPPISRDPADNAFIACAEWGKADFIVTLNTRDFPQAKLGPAVLTPERFLRQNSRD